MGEGAKGPVQEAGTRACQALLLDIDVAHADH